MRNNFTIGICLTNNCNIMCDYCLAYVPYDNNIKGIMTNTIMQTIIKCINTYLIDYDITMVLSGGELLTHPYINDVLQYIYTIKNLRHIELCSNATLLIKNIIHYDKYVHYDLSFHIDTLLDKGYYDYINNFIENVKYLNSKGISYNVKIMDKAESNNIVKKQYYIDLIKYLIKDGRIKYAPIKPTKKYHYDKNVVINKYYNKLVYYRRAINITQAILTKSNGTPSIYFSYICDMENIDKYTSIYSIKEWRQLKEHYNDSRLCKVPVCYCPKCEEIC